MIRICAIGTCRIEMPLWRNSLGGDIGLDLTGVYGRCHTSKEVLQMLRAMSGDVVLPDELIPFISSRPRDMGLNDLTDVDVLVVELSSVKEVVFREFFLQLVLTTKRLNETSERVRDWWREFSRRGIDVEDRAALLGDELPPIEAAIVAEGKIKMQGAEEIKADMAAIAERSPVPVLFVTHIDVSRPETGQRVHGRAEMIRAMRQAGDELGYRVYDPTADVLAYAAEYGLSAAIKGPNHYTNALINQMLRPKIHSEAIAAIEIAGGRENGRDSALRTGSLV